MIPLVLLRIALAGSLLGISPAEDLAGAIERLGAPRADVRAQAERELAWRFVDADPGELLAGASALANGDAEPRRRFARALASRDANLGLVVELIDTELDDVGRQALRGLVARWLTDPLGVAKVHNSLTRDVEALASRSPREVFVAPEGVGVRSAIHALLRHVDTPMGIAIDPALVSQAELEASRAASWFPLLRDLASRLPDATLVGYGIDPFAPLNERRGWLALVPRARTGRTAGRVLVDWCLATRSKDPLKRSRALAALLATGWPAASAWIERAAVAGDSLARAELLDAAGRGRVATSLTTKVAVERSLEEFDTLSVAAHAQRRLNALRRLAPIAPDGSPHAQLALANWGALDERQRFARWVLLGAWGTRGADADRVSELAQVELARDDLDARLIEPVLSALVARGPGASKAAIELSPRTARLAVTDAPQSRALLLSDARLDPPAQADFASWAPDRAVACLGWLLGRGAEDRAANLALELGRAPSSVDVYPALEPWLRRGGPRALGGFFRKLRAVAGADDPAVTRLRFLAGDLTGPAAGDYLRSLGVPKTGVDLADRDFTLQATIVARGRGAIAQRALDTLRADLARFGRDATAVDPPTELLAAIDRVLDGFYSQGRDEEIEPLIGFLEELLRSAPAPWVRELRGRWPLPPRVRAIELASADRRWAR